MSVRERLQVALVAPAQAASRAVAIATRKLRDAGAAVRSWARTLRTRILALYLAARHPQTPRAVRLLIVVVVAYALSPIDLIPDFIPVLGLLDDVVLVPAGIWLVVRLLPAALWQACCAEAATRPQRLARSRVAAGVIVAIWLVAAVAVTVYVVG